MKLATLTIALSFAVAGIAAPALAGSGCAYNQSTSTEAKAVKEISVEKLATYVTSKDQTVRAEYVVFDANGKDTRDKFGVVPGATLLSHYSTYEVSETLPAARDANVVFYCSSTKCSAAPKAAQKALDSGYVNVYVMPAGIMGWNEAGKPTTKIKSRS